MSEACAAIVARDDPHLHATALFAPEPARSWLMVLYAFDIELSRAAHASAESLIPLMRLQWWRDVAEAARAGTSPPEHEVAGPLARLVVERRLPAEPVEALITAREAELEGGFDETGFAAWADGRFGALTALAALLLGGGDETVVLARRAGPVLGAAFALRHAAAMAAEDRFLLPGLAAVDRADLAHGEETPGVRVTARELAVSALGELAALRADRRQADRRATPAFLPLTRAGRVLRRAARLETAPDAGPEVSARPTPISLRDLDADRPFDGLRLALRAATGRW